MHRVESLGHQARQQAAGEVGLVAVLTVEPALEPDRVDAPLHGLTRVSGGGDVDDLVAAPGERGGQFRQEPLGATAYLWPAEGMGERDPHRRQPSQARRSLQLPPMPSASVIVPARDAGDTLPRTLRALAQQRFAGEFEVIVVDDGSRDGTVAAARRAGPAVTVIEQTPQGPAAARNAGAARARGEVLAFCDADVYPTSGWLQAGVDALAEADLVQGRVLPDPAATVGPFDRTLWISSQVGLWETANLFVTRRAFDAAGGFEQWLTPRRGKALAEDVWFGYRVLRAGARPAFCAAALAHHAVFPRAWRAYAAERARLRFFPAMAARMPELRRAFLHRRLFLNARTARFDLALAAAGMALAARRPAALLGVAPYARAVVVAAQRAPAPARPGVAAADVIADALGAVALAAGSIRYRSPVL